MRAIGALALCVALGGCAGVAAQKSVFADADPGVVISLSSSQVSAVQSGLRGALKDPNSAIFGKMAANKHADGRITVCGWVNAKNSYGGYTGDSPFLGGLVDGTFVVIDIGGLETTSMAIAQTCAAYGAPLPT